MAGLPFGKLLTSKSKEQNHIAQYGGMCHRFSTMKGLCLKTAQAKECCRYTSVVPTAKPAGGSAMAHAAFSQE